VRKEISEAIIGDPTLRPSLAFIDVWTGTTDPAMSALTINNRIIENKPPSFLNNPSIKEVPANVDESGFRKIKIIFGDQTVNAP
jgi:hypothetical protein